MKSSGPNMKLITCRNILTLKRGNLYGSGNQQNQRQNFMFLQKDSNGGKSNGHLRISLCPGEMDQFSLQNATTVMNGDIFQIISHKFLLIVSVLEGEDVVEVHVLVNDPALYCYILQLVLFSMLMECFQAHGYSWIPVWPQVYTIIKK